MFRKLKEKRGFTLGETLVAVLILLMVVGVIGGAIPAAGKAYVKVVDGANAQILLSTAMTVLRDELSTASDIKVNQKDPNVPADSSEENSDFADGNFVIQYKNNNGWCRIVCRNTGSNMGIEIQYRQPDEIAGTGKYKYERNRNLVSEKASAGDMYLAVTKVEVKATDKNVVSFEGLTVKQKGKTADLASADFVIRSVG